MKVKRGLNSVGWTNARSRARKKPASDPSAGGDHQRLQLVDEWVLSERPRGVLVLTDASQHPAPGRALHEVEGGGRHQREDPDHEEQWKERLRVAPAEGDEPFPDGVGDAVPRIVEAEETLVAAGQAGGVLDAQPHDLGRGDGGDREVVGAQPQRGQADQQAECHRDGHRDRQRQPEREAGLDDENRHGVGADRHEPCLPEVDDAREADVQLQAEREQRVDAGQDADARPELDRGERLERDRKGERHGGRSRAISSWLARRCPAA